MPCPQSVASFAARQSNAVGKEIKLQSFITCAHILPASLLNQGQATDFLLDFLLCSPAVTQTDRHSISSTKALSSQSSSPVVRADADLTHTLQSFCPYSGSFGYFAVKSQIKRFCTVKSDALASAQAGLKLPQSADQQDQGTEPLHRAKRHHMLCLSVCVVVWGRGKRCQRTHRYITAQTLNMT